MTDGTPRCFTCDRLQSSTGKQRPAKFLFLLALIDCFSSLWGLADVLGRLICPSSVETRLYQQASLYGAVVKRRRRGGGSRPSYG